MARSIHLIALSVVCSAAMAATAFAAGTPEQKCASAKMKAAGKALSALSKCQSKAFGSGTNADSECIQKAGDKFDDAFAKADDANECLHEGDAAPISVKILSTVLDITSDLGCGNGRLDGDETCDDDSSLGGDGCDATCQTELGYQCAGTPSVCATVCGDGVLGGVETCDDGGITSADGCSDNCSVESGYQCFGEPSVCTPVCGDGLVVAGEGCDQGNVVNGDGCDSSCNVESGYGCAGEPSVCSPICGMPGQFCLLASDCCSFTCFISSCL